MKRELIFVIQHQFKSTPIPIKEQGKGEKRGEGKSRRRGANTPAHANCFASAAKSTTWIRRPTPIPIKLVQWRTIIERGKAGNPSKWPAHTSGVTAISAWTFPFTLQEKKKKKRKIRINSNVMLTLLNWFSDISKLIFFASKISKFRNSFPRISKISNRLLIHTLLCPKRATCYMVARRECEGEWIGHILQTVFQTLVLGWCGMQNPQLPYVFLLNQLTLSFFVIVRNTVEGKNASFSSGFRAHSIYTGAFCNNFILRIFSPLFFRHFVFDCPSTFQWEVNSSCNITTYCTPHCCRT